MRLFCICKPSRAKYAVIAKHSFAHNYTLSSWVSVKLLGAIKHHPRGCNVLIITDGSVASVAVGKACWRYHHGAFLGLELTALIEELSLPPLFNII